MLSLINIATRGQQTTSFLSHSDYALVYKLSLEEAKTILNSGSISFTKSDLFNRLPYDTLHSSEDKDYMNQNGFYLKVEAIEQQLKTSLNLVQNLEIKRIPDRKHLRFIILGSDGREVIPEEVSIEGKSIRYNESIRAFRTRPQRGRSTVVIKHKGEEAVFPVFKGFKPFFHRFGNKVLYSFPVKLVYKPGRDIYQSVAYGEPIGIVRRAGSLFFRDLRYERAYGYLLLNKPKYKPGDTLRYKLKLARENGRPYSKKVDLIISGIGQNKFRRSLRLKKGQAEGEIVLHDSLNLRLDGYQRLAVMKHGDQLISTSFDYEDYSLKSESYKLNLDKKRHSSFETNEVILSGKDENDKRLKNSRYELEVSVTSLERHTAKGHIYIPRILMKQQGRLAPDKDTKITLSDSIFPRIGMKYQVKIAFINAANDRVEQTETGTYLPDQPEISLDIEKDSVVFSFPEAYKGNRQLNIIGESSLDRVLLNEDAPSNLRVRLNPSFFSYKVYSPDSLISKAFEVRPLDDGISHHHHRSADSLKINIENDHKLPMWYTLYRENRKIREGYTEAPLGIQIRAKNKDSYLMSYRYLWGGTVSNRDFEMDIYDKALNIKVDQQSLVIPGIQDSICIKVTDYKGRPVANVDVASVAITGKFKNDNIPNIPYFGLSGQLRSNNTNFSSRHRSDRSVHLNYQQWKKPFQLDSILYYQLTHPKGLDIQYIDCQGGPTQFAVLTMKNGAPRSIAYIKLDDQLVYTPLRHQREPFSFRSSEGFHKIELRTYSELITIDSVYFEKDKKTLITIKDGFAGPHITRIDSADHRRWPLNKEERELLAAHTLQVQLSKRQTFSVVQHGRQHDFTNSYQKNIRLGPFRHDSLSIITQNRIYKILFEPGHIYEFTNDQVFKKASAVQYFSFSSVDSKRLFEFLPAETVLDNDSPKEKLRWFPYRQIDFNETEPIENSGILIVNPPEEKLRDLTNAYILSEADSSFVIGLDSELAALLPGGHYEVVLVYQDDSFIHDKLFVKEEGITIISPEPGQWQPVDQLPPSLSGIYRTDKETVKPQVIHIPKPSPNLTGFVSGVVTGADDGLPLPQVTVLLKGTTLGTPTDMDGFFRLPLPDRGGVLVFRYLGYVTQEIELGTQSIVNVQLSPDVASLSEVVVTGYGVQSSIRRPNQVTVLNSTATGVSITPGAAFQVRGLNNIRSAAPLYIVDGIPVSSIDDIPQESISDLSVLKAASATAIYGARGANGVVLITTKGPGQLSSVDKTNSDIEQASSGNSIRNNFRDYAYWAPSVTTDKNGEAVLLIQYPDDITSWKNHFLAMSNRGFTGQLKTTTNAFKPLISKLMVPRFLIEGDSTWVYGQISNYIGDSIQVTRNFQLAHKSYDLGSWIVSQGHVDSLGLTAANTDSLEVVYQFKASSGNDGERRKVPVLKKGMIQTEGHFYHLNKDTTFSITPTEAFSKPTVTIISDLRDLMLQDIQNLQQYAYWCNEQKASKLIALLAERQLLNRTENRFKKNSRINGLIRRIRKSRNADGGWGWWNNMRSSPWITNHVTKALLLAQLQGFDTRTDLHKSSERLLEQLASFRGRDLIETMHVLLDVDSTLNLNDYLTVAQAQDDLSVTDKIRLLHLTFRVHKKVSLDSLRSYKRISSKSGVFYEDAKNGVRSNTIMASLSAYQLLKAVGGYDIELADIRNCLLLNRQSAALRNTYEAASIINTIGADLDTVTLTSDIKLNGAAIGEFPYQTTMTDYSPISIKINSGNRAYLTVSQTHTDINPKPSDDLGQIRTMFLNGNGKRPEHLIKGQRITLKVELDLTEKQDFAMLEVPVPAGCNYYEKSQPIVSGQYREYFKDKTNIYFEHLTPGKYEFEIHLVSQFSGKYTLNPARLSLMYFPLLKSNNEMKQVTIH